METSVKLSEGGRVVIPAEYRKQLGMEIGDELILRIVDGELRLTTKAEAIRIAQRLVRAYVKEGRSLSQELIAERRQEYGRE